VCVASIRGFLRVIYETTWENTALLAEVLSVAELPCGLSLVSNLSCFLWLHPLRVSRPLQKQLVQHQNNIWWAFCEYDRDGNGVITAEELAKILGEGEGVGKMISEYDLDHDGMINYEVRASAVWCHIIQVLGPAHAPSPRPAQCVCLRCCSAAKPRCFPPFTHASPQNAPPMRACL
jgi:hypothetical protein